ncbi:hypothetical protein [Jannaschia aquimarina]|uniref:Uncharacterized protein n=1 Tax=Jannaschia aquimarina TaxID=935700 RepID=A0A0D1E9N7_9RHOB|nr:hypothetical protein [Jannaschia aquimarina]KIT14384.1 hypothetical protein jaqu_39740 [Jannaschia aquimarina]SNS87466.1 hypothetical protein SAMN05421775_103107 [Jannaschia aquimarina]
MLDSSTDIRAIRQDALGAAGPAASLRRRARGYLDLYHAPNGTCLFALVEAHGALWAAWYLACAKCAALPLALLDPTVRMSPAKRYRQFATYVDALKEINQLVMVETYVLIHTIKRHGPEGAIAEGIPADLAHDYARALDGPKPSAETLRDLYHRHFTWEQDRVISDKLDDAFAVFTWSLMRSLCQRPWVWFSYFKVGKSMNFRSFTDKVERIEKGLIAVDRAIEFGPERLARRSDLRLKIFPGL